MSSAISWPNKVGKSQYQTRRVPARDRLLTCICGSHYNTMLPFPFGCIFVILRMHRHTLELRLEFTSVCGTGTYCGKRRTLFAYSGELGICEFIPIARTTCKLVTVIITDIFEYVCRLRSLKVQILVDSSHDPDSRVVESQILGV